MHWEWRVSEMEQQRVSLALHGRRCVGIKSCLDSFLSGEHQEPREQCRRMKNTKMFILIDEWNSTWRALSGDDSFTWIRGKDYTLKGITARFTVSGCILQCCVLITKRNVKVKRTNIESLEAAYGVSISYLLFLYSVYTFLRITYGNYEERRVRSPANLNILEPLYLQANTYV